MKIFADGSMKQLNQFELLRPPQVTRPLSDEYQKEDGLVALARYISMPTFVVLHR